MEYISKGDLRLAYQEKNRAAKQAVFFIHGNSSSSRSWEKQFNDKLFDGYRLIAFDIPGTGQSTITDRDHWDYSPLQTGMIIADAIKELSNNRPYCLVGFSYGSNVVAETLSHGLTPVGIVLVSPSVIGSGIGLDKVFEAGDFIFFHDEVKYEEGKDFFTKILVNGNEKDIRIHTEDFIAAKTPFRSALIQSVGLGKLSDEIGLLISTGIPAMVIFGTEDKLLQIQYLDEQPFGAWRNKIHKIPGAGHYVHIDQPTHFNELLSDYLKEKFSN